MHENLSCELSIQVNRSENAIFILELFSWYLSECYFARVHNTQNL